MSTFGKKAINCWDYNTFDTKRWVGTPKDIQMEILKKWFPIGMKCHNTQRDYSNGRWNVDWGTTWEIVGYQEQLWGWIPAGPWPVILALKIKKVGSPYTYEKSPMLIVPTLEDIRDRKLTKIL